MEQLVNFVIRPPRADYCPDTDLLDDEFSLRGKLYTRKDLEITNKRGDILKCSHYLPVHTPGGKPLPCVIYCHGNSGCRVDASEAAIILLPSNITVFTLDFSGSGLSGGDHVSLGWNEKDDLRAVVDYLRAEGNVSLIGLWGRSMGAVTSLMYAAEDPSIAGMVLDSPFSVLVDLMMELVDTYNVRLPKFTVKFAIQFMRRAIMKKAKFDITGLDAVKVAKTCFVPALFGHAIDDEFVLPHHSDRIFEAYMGDKNIIKFEGDHNSPRPQFYFDSINIFFHNVLQPPEDEIGGTFSDNMHYYFGKSSQGTEHGLGYGQRNSTLSKEVATRGSTAEAINELRSKQSMSKTEVPFDHRRKGDESEEEDFVIDGDSRASSSGMINFELSNGGHPYGPHVPIAFDDDQYVEFQLDDLTGFPCSANEEEKMLMEAIRESLKDVEIRGQNTTKEPTLDSRTDSFGSSPLRDVEASSATETSAASKTDDSASSSAVHGERPSLEAAAVSSSSSSSSQALIPSPPSNNNTITENNQGSAQPITAPNITVPPNEDADVSATTKATVTVVKNPSSHILDGLLRRWDFNCFRGGR